MEKSKNRNPNTEELEKGFHTAFIDGEYNSNLAYRPEFLSNNAAEGKKVLSAIESELLRCDEFAISVAFITNSGIEPFMQTFKELERRNIPGRILTTNYLNFSDPKALRRLSKLQNLEIRMYVTDDESEGFHTKGYLFRKDEMYRVIVGSSNITLGALTRNREWIPKWYPPNKVSSLPKSVRNSSNCGPRSGRGVSKILLINMNCCTGKFRSRSDTGRRD